MAKIPRSEPTGVGIQLASMPHSTGDGYEAPGRALQQLGKGLQGLGSGIASLAGGLKGDADREQDLRDRLAMLQFSNQQDMDAIKARDTPIGVDDDGVPNWGGYADRQASAYDGAAAGFLPSISQRNQMRARLFLEQKRGSLVEGAMRYEQGRRHESLFAKGDRAIGGEFAKLSGVDPAQFDQAFEATISGVDAIINGMPPNERARAALRNMAADQARALLQGMGAGKEYPTIRRYIERWTGKPYDADAENDPVAQGTAPGAPAAAPGPVSFVAPPLQRTVGRARQSGQIRGIVMHQTWGSDTMEGNGSWSNKTGTGAHFYIAKDGKVFQWADPETVAMAHAGKGRGVGGDKRPDLTNDNTIGIEIMTRPNERPNEKQIAVARQLGLQLLEKYRLTPQDVMGHGELAPGHRMANEAIEAVEAIRNGGTTAGGLKVQLSAYAPKQGGDRMEGGYASSRPGPDGKAEVRTLEDVASGRSPYVTLAGNPSHYGKSYTIPSIAFIGTDGKTQTLTNVRGVVHDTGSAFKSAPEGRFDVPVARDADAKTMAANHAAWKKAGVEFVPASSEAAAKPVPVAERGLTRYAGLVPASRTDATDDGNDPVAQGTAPGQIADTPRGDNAIPGAQGQQLAQAGAPLGRVDATRSQLIEQLIKALPAARARHLATIDAMMRRAESVAIEGKALPDGQMEELRAAVGAMRDPMLLQRLGLLDAGIREATAQRQATPAELEAVIGQINMAMTQSGKATPELIARRDALIKLKKATEQGLKDNPYELATSRSLAPPPITIDPAQGPQALAAALSDRQLKQAALQARYGARHPIPLFQSSEVEAVGAYLQSPQVPWEARAGALRMMYEVLGSRTSAAMGELAKKSPELAHIGWMVANKGPPEAIKDAIAGLDLTRMENFKTRLPNDGVLLAATDTVTGIGRSAFAESPEARNSALGVAKLIYQARAERKGLDPKNPATAFDPQLWTESLQAAFGQSKGPDGKTTYGGLHTLGTFGWGDKVFVPAWVKSDAIGDVFAKIRMSDLVRDQQPGQFAGTFQAWQGADRRMDATVTPRAEPSPAKAAAAAAGREEPGPGAVRPTGREVFDPGTAMNVPEMQQFPAAGAQARYMPGTPTGRPIDIATLRSATPVWIGGSAYILRTGFGTNGVPQYIGVRGSEANFVIDLEALRDTLKPRLPENTFRD